MNCLCGNANDKVDRKATRALFAQMGVKTMKISIVTYTF